MGWINDEYNDSDDHNNVDEGMDMMILYIYIYVYIEYIYIWYCGTNICSLKKLVHWSEFADPAAGLHGM